MDSDKSNDNQMEITGKQLIPYLQWKFKVINKKGKTTVNLPIAIIAALVVFAFPLMIFFGLLEILRESTFRIEKNPPTP